MPLDIYTTGAYGHEITKSPRIQNTDSPSFDSFPLEFYTCGHMRKCAIEFKNDEPY